MLEALRSATEADMQAIQQAYEVLTRIGNATAAGEVWDEYIDRAHQDLGLLLAVRYAQSTASQTIPPRKARLNEGNSRQHQGRGGQDHFLRPPGSCPRGPRGAGAPGRR